MENNTFKSALFGGFRREDVIAYIQKSAAEFGERIAALEASEKKLEQENTELRGEVTSVTDARDRLSEALHENFDKQEALSAELNTAKAELDELRSRLTAAEEERDRLRTEAETLRVQAKEYCAVKANLTELELAAHQRAEAYEAEVHSRADAYEAEAHRRIDEHEAASAARLREKVADCRIRCDRLVASMEESCTGFSAQLHVADETVGRMPGALRTLLDELDTMGAPE